MFSFILLTVPLFKCVPIVFIYVYLVCVFFSLILIKCSLLLNCDRHTVVFYMKASAFYMNFALYSFVRQSKTAALVCSAWNVRALMSKCDGHVASFSLCARAYNFIFIFALFLLLLSSAIYRSRKWDLGAL